MGRTAKAALIILIAGYLMSIISPEAATREDLHLTAGIASVMAEYLKEAASEPVKDNQTEETGQQSEGISETDGYLLARIAMAEAESEDTKGKALIMRVVLNRVESTSFPDTVEGVIFERNQFTPISDGRWQRVEPNEDCYKALQMIEDGWDESQGATYFELTASKATWHRSHLQKLFEHNTTSFYKEY